MHGKATATAAAAAARYCQAHGDGGALVQNNDASIERRAALVIIAKYLLAHMGLHIVGQMQDRVV
jgi:hypothetical protein